MTTLVAGSMVGPYRIEGLLGRGGMATVYLATHASIGRPAALKVLDPRLGAREDLVRRFAHEGRMQASLEHAHVVAVYETVPTPDGLFIAMQLVRGPTLATLIAGGALTAARAVSLLGQIADAIDAAHETGLVHRDIKPRNVLVGDGDHAYLADFGLTTVGDESGDLTATGEVLGTVAYLAPEVIRGERATAASDRYSFAALAFECLTGSVVFPRPTQAAQLYAHTSEPAPRISVRHPDLPVALDRVFERALTKAPADRPASARQIVTSIRAAIGEDLLATLGPPVPLRSLDGDASESTLSPNRPLTLPAQSTARTSARRRLIRAMVIAAGALIAGTAGAVIGASGSSDGDASGTEVPPLLDGAVALGSDLAAPGPTVDCRGGAVRLASTACSVMQSRLPGRTIVVPRDGAIRRWAVRSALGELQLQVLRTRDGEAYFQLATSRSEFVSDTRPHAFRTDLAVEAGDVLGLSVISGSGVGVRKQAGASIRRWTPRVRGVAAKPDGSAGLQGELLLRVEYVPGARQQLPPQVTGAAAAALPAGKLVERKTVTPPGLRPIELRLVEAQGVFNLELFLRGRRLVRQPLPDFTAGVGEVVAFDTYVNEGDANAEVSLEYQRLDSARRISHFLLVTPRAIELIS